MIIDIWGMRMCVIIYICKCFILKYKTFFIYWLIQANGEWSVIFLKKNNTCYMRVSVYIWLGRCARYTLPKHTTVGIVQISNNNWCSPWRLNKIHTLWTFFFLSPPQGIIILPTLPHLNYALNQHISLEFEPSFHM